MISMSSKASRAALGTAVVGLFMVATFKAPRGGGTIGTDSLAVDAESKSGDDIEDLRKQLGDLSRLVKKLQTQIAESEGNHHPRPARGPGEQQAPVVKEDTTSVTAQSDDNGEKQARAVKEITTPVPAQSDDNGEKHQSERRVIAFSLYNGNLPRYGDGAVVNARLWKQIFPDWEMWVYHDATTPEKVLATLRAAGVKLIDMRNSGLSNAMTWRFTVAAEASVDRFIIRDIDARLNTRDKDAIDEWIKSGKRFHVLRDHPSHSNYPMSGGLWGGTKDAIPDIISRLKAKAISKEYVADMNWLTNVIWPIAQQSVMQHDAFSCDKFGGGHPFPSQREYPEQHVGSVHVKATAKERKGDSDMLIKAIKDGQQPGEYHADHCHRTAAVNYPVCSQT